MTLVRDQARAVELKVYFNRSWHRIENWTEIDLVNIACVWFQMSLISKDLAEVSASTTETAN